MRKRKIWTPGRGYLYLLIPPGIFLCLLFIWPLATVVYQGLFQPSFGFANYATILASTTHLRVLLYTFKLAGEVTLICLLIAYPVAYMMSRAGDNMLHVALAIVLIPFWTSVVIRTYAWAALFQRRGLVNDLLVQAGIVDEPVKFIYNNTGVLIGMVQILLPFMILPLLNAMRRMDMTLIRAAEILGANPVRVLFHVYLPLSMPGVTAGVLLVFISAVGFYVTPAVLGGPRQMMIAVLIEQYVTRTLNWPLASALATILLAATTVLYLIYERATRRVGSALNMGRS